MASRLGDLLQSLRDSREGYVPAVQAFPSLDLDQIARNLKLEQRGKADGELNRPPADSDVEQLPEQDVRAEIDHRARRAAEDYRSQLELYHARIRRAVRSSDTSVEIDAAGESALADFKVQANDDLDHLHAAKREVEEREREFREFRRAHELSRLPRLLSEQERLIRWLLLALFVVLESILNGLFFAQASEAGLIGGVTEAFVLSALNVGSAILYARFALPLLFHRRSGAKASGALLTMIYIPWSVGLNLAIGHFRDMFVARRGNFPVSEMLTRILTSAFELADVRSLVLVLLGLGLNLLAVIDGFGLDDSYPGYGAVGRTHARAQAVYNDMKARCLAGLTLRRDRAIDQMSEVIRLIRDAAFDLDLSVSGMQRLAGDYAAYGRHLSESEERLLQRYREANVRARTEPPPERFMVRSGPRHSLHEILVTDVPKYIDTSGPGAIDRMQHFIGAVNRAFEAAVERYDTLASLTSRPEARDVDA
jgi:hypothetical protein